MEINLLVRSLSHQFPAKYNVEVIDNDTHFTILIKNPSEKLDNYFGRFFEESNKNGCRMININNGDCKRLLDLSVTLKRYFL